MTAGGLRVATIRRLLYPDTGLHRIACNVPEAADALGVDKRKLWALLRAGQIPARHTGKQYILAHATIIEIHGGPIPGFHDHRDPQYLQPDRLYTRANLAVVLGVSRPVVRGLVEGGRIDESEAIGSARYTTGATLRDFLDRAGEPLRETG